MFKRLLLAALVFTALLAPYYLKSQTAHAVLSSNSYAFGTVKQGSKVIHAFAVRNLGDKPLEFTSAEMNMPGMKVRMKPMVLPGEEGVINIEWDTAHVKGDIEGEAYIYTNDRQMPQFRLVLSGKVTPPIEVLPMAAAFFSVYEDEPAERVLTIQNHADAPMKLGPVEPKGTHFIAFLKEVEMGKTYNLHVRVPAHLSPGRYTEAVELATSDPQKPRLRVPVNVLVKTDVFVNPEVVDFGRISIADVETNPRLISLLAQTFLIKKRADQQFRLLNISANLPMLEIKAAPANAPSSAHRVDVTLNDSALKPGKLSGTIIIETDDPRHPRFEVPVTGELY